MHDGLCLTRSEIQKTSFLLTQLKYCPSKSHLLDLSRVMRKPVFSICENKDADQLRCNRAADQRLCLCYIDSSIPLLTKSKISSFWPSYVLVQPDLCQTWSETPKTSFLMTRPISFMASFQNHKVVFKSSVNHIFTCCIGNQHRLKSATS